MVEHAPRAPIRSCFPPSPTGYLHVGGARSALFDWLAARSTGGQFILRIEDTDRSRLQEATVEAIFDGLRWLGLQWDEGPEVGGPFGPYVQSERLPLYQQWAHWLLEHSRAYEDFSPPRVQGQQVTATGKHEFREYRDLSLSERAARHDAYIQTHDSAPAIRLKMQLDGETVARDLIRGEIRWQNTDLPVDPVLLKGDGFPTYHLAEAVDDHFMNRNVVMRGQEWIPSMPLHALLFRAFGWDEPIFCHLPLVTGADGKKLSKRHGDAGLHEYREQGYLPEAIVNFCALLGWSFGDDIEIFSKEEAIPRFCIEDIRPAPSVWDMDKLLWINGQWINHRLTLDEFVERSLPFLHDAGLAEDAPREYISRALSLEKERVKTLAQVPEATRFFFAEPSADASIVTLLKKQGGDQAGAMLEAALNLLADADWSARDGVVAAIDAVVAQFGVKRGVPFGLLRIATTGRTAAPDQADLMLVLGPGRVDQRIRAAIDALKATGEG